MGNVSMGTYSADDLAALALAIYGEARSEPRVGQDAVAHVVLGRSRRANVPITHVVYGSGDYQNGQYSFANPGIYSRALGKTPTRDPDGWAKAVAVAEDALEGRTKDPTGGATHYFNPDHNSKTSDEWAKSMENLGMIGNHQFWRENDGAVGITRAAARSRHRREPGQGHLNPGVFAHDVMFALDAPTGPAIPVPGGRGVSQSDHSVQALAYEPGSGDMGIYPRQTSGRSDQFAPGPKAAPKSAIQDQPVRGDYPTGPTNPTPWQDSFAPAPQYAPGTASPARFDKTFALSDPQALPLTPGTSNTAKAAAYRGLGDSMQQAGIGGLDGRAATQSQAGIDRYGPVNAEHSPSIPPVPSHRPPVPVPFTPPIPKARPQSVAPAPTARPSAPPHSNVPLPTPRPSTYSALPMAPPHRTQMHQQPSPYTGPKKQIFDFVLRQLLEPAPGPK